jgi:thymidylate synthase
MILTPINVRATDLNDAWHQCVFAILKHGRKFKIDKGRYEGGYRLEFDYITVHITHPETRPLEPQIPTHYGIPNPVESGYILGDDLNFKGRPYIEYLMTDCKEPGEDYTYGSRLCGDIVNQIEKIIHTYKTHGYRNNQMVLQIAQPSDILLSDPPCLRHIDTRIQDGRLHFFPYFRSWDLWGGFPANLAAIQILKEYMAGEIGVESGEIIASSKGLHLYKYVWELAELRRGIKS